MKLIEYHFNKTYDITTPGIVGTEYETRWFVRRILWLWFIPIMSQTIRMETNQAIASVCFGDYFEYSKYWKPELNKEPDKIVYL